MILWWAACGGGDTPVLPCAGEADPALELAPADVDYAAFTDGDPIHYGTPPQGGAPYAPFHGRIAGLADLHSGANVTMTATDDADGTLLGTVGFGASFTCANVGDSAGKWVGADLHLRFDGFDLDQLDGRDADVVVRIEDLEGGSVDAELLGHLVRF